MESIPLKFAYEKPQYGGLPHVVKFSGGRSSGMMLVSLLDTGDLRAERGDVVVFNNTGAEHPATYDFVRRCAEYTESCGVPFFWIEYATYEDAHNGDWARLSSFRLVNSRPLSPDNPEGYHWRGEVFEEMVSHQGFLPSRHTRSCTAHLKLKTTNDFLSEWFAGKASTERQGHYEDEPQVSDEAIIRRHRRSRGEQSDADLLRKRAFVRQRPWIRTPQRFDDFSAIGAAGVMQSSLANSNVEDYAPMRGSDAIEFVSVIGLRADEPRRVERVKRCASVAPGMRSRDQPDGEIVLTPLADSGVDSEAVKRFWQQRSWRLELPEDANLSNCVYCFMKGAYAIRAIHRNMQAVDAQLPTPVRSVSDTPSDIRWWAALEERYRRRAVRKGNGDGDKHVSIGFWGVDATESYESLQDEGPVERVESDALPCECTD